MPATYGFLSTYPPTQCGLATFNAALATHLVSGTPGSGVVRLLASDNTSGGIELDGAAPRVVHTWHTDRPGGWVAATTALNRFDVVIVQHEYGIYPGDAGAEILPVLRGLRVPVIVVLHTVLTHPDQQQRTVLEQIVATADAVVTMTDTARTRLTGFYDVDPRKITVIPHGAASHAGLPRSDAGEPNHRPHLLTWGLLGPGKGIEWALRALAFLDDVEPRPIYTVAGRTHPSVLQQQGDVYRDSLKAIAEDRGVADCVRWEDVYLDPDDLSRLITSADAVVLPYDSTEQVTSGVLIEAVAAGIPVVATEFPHAVELLADGPGLLVPHQDPEAMAMAIRRVLAEPGLPGRLTGLAGGPTLRWPAVAARYSSLAARLTADRRPLAAQTISA
ncbi:glycosyltransferase involved in cell wall biosynthesis [Actinoplanes lutulentus]|uniref:Glycosyltransferase involved in cell wall biosynthesis n=1 Tax=Actinoplanes lutulentus TaxID=1287878 RepID=A0A327ZDJ2_9ACTN|nr:glycosyltransferase [Actinoplanes lutulentus]RAK38212.1 glycosyltransferase involved in cell wall biosynthesis [Actinoplanes lutulentus]